MSTPQTDTPETEKIFTEHRLGRSSISRVKVLVENLESRAIAAEARVKELEAEVASETSINKELTDNVQKAANEIDKWKKRAKTENERYLSQLEATAKLDREARRLRPIAEAGPVPEGMVRVYAERYLNIQWLFAEDPCSSDTHFIDIYPPQQ